MVSGPLGLSVLSTLFVTLSTVTAATPSWGGSRHQHNGRAHHVEHAKRAFPSGWTSTTAQCVVDSTTARVLSKQVSVSTTLTTDICVDLCNKGNYKYAGVEYGKECWCGNTLPAKLTTSTACTMPCGGNKNQSCGGGNALRLFTKTPVTSSSKKATSTSSKKVSTTSSKKVTTSTKKVTTSSKKVTTTSSKKVTTTSSKKVTTTSSKKVTTTSSSKKTSSTSSAKTSSAPSSVAVSTSHATTTSSPTSSPSSTSASTSSAAPEATTYPNPNHLFPSLPIKDGWTVATFAEGDSVDHLQELAHTNTTLIYKKNATGSQHPVVDAHGRLAILAHMTQGSLTPGKEPYAGFSFYTYGPGTSTTPLVDLKTATEMTFSYSIYFQEDFDFNLGGKLPGLYGGTTEDIAVTCSGGSHDPGCFSARLMFRPEGAGELYLYIPPGTNNNDSVCGPNGDQPCPGASCDPATEDCETTYGNSAGRGNWHWKTGQWQTVSQRILLNTPGVADGEAEVYVDGVSVLLVKKITWRTDAASVTRGAQMQIFFGGHTDEWRCPKDQDVFFADLSAGIIE